MVFDIVSQSGILASSMNEIDFSSVWNSENTRERKKITKNQFENQKVPRKEKWKE